MTELRIWTARQSIRVTAPPKRVFELVADIGRWPALFDSCVSVERLGFDGLRERVRYRTRHGDVLRDWTSVRELDPARLRIRFRHVDFPPPLASMGGRWLVVPKGTGSVIELDHYYRVADDDPATAAAVERDITTTGAAMLGALRQTAEFSGGMANLIESYSDVVTAEGDTSP
jgi:aromatase